MAKTGEITLSKGNNGEASKQAIQQKTTCQKKMKWTKQPKRERKMTPGKTARMHNCHKYCSKKLSL
eukprot:5540018-Ditylum_brightwellii.AAC.1